MARTDSQRGYALVMVVFFVALVMITVSAATATFLTQERREKEQEMIWRGQQYVRGIHLYYQKMHRFPMQLEDLYQPKTGIRFMRKAYSDPLNTADGSWRLIYVGPNGQLIGSLQQNSLFPTRSAPTQAPFVDSLLANASTSGSLTSQNPSSSSSSTTEGSASNLAVNMASSNASTPAQEQLTPQTIAQPLDSVSSITGNAIIGVGSKVNRASIIWYEKAKDYKHFEFIWKAKTQDPMTVTPNP